MLIIPFWLWGDVKPNILIILADDCTYNDLPLYGGLNAKTPNLDRLAQEGLTFNQAYVSSSMCQHQSHLQSLNRNQSQLS